MSPLLLLTFVTLAVRANVIPDQGQPPALSPADEALFNTYGNFTAGIAKALVDNDVAMQSGPHTSAGGASASQCPAPQGITATSAYGIGHILAVLHENVWKVGVPVFQDLLASTPASLPDAFALISGKLFKTPDITFSSAIFTTDSISMTPALTKLGVKTVNADLTQQSAVDTINSNVNTFVGHALEQSYIPKGATISPAAKAVVVDTLQVSEAWDSTVTKVTTPHKFNGVDTVEMFEIKGNYQVMENDNAVEVVVTFKNNLRGLSLVLPKDITAAFNGNLGEPAPANYTSVRVQLPVFKTTLRNYEANLTNQCNFKKEENFFQLLDHVITISMSQDKFESTSITGAQITNVQKFKTAQSSDKSVSPCAASTVQDAVAPPPQAPAPASDPKATEKLITFDRSFTWTLLDHELGPIMAGTVLSLSSTQAPPPASAAYVFGLETPLGYSKCL